MRIVRSEGELPSFNELMSEGDRRGRPIPGVPGSNEPSQGAQIHRASEGTVGGPQGPGDGCEGV